MDNKLLFKKVQQKLKSFWDKKIYSAVLIAILIIYGVFYYLQSFYINQGLSFTKEDQFILIIIGFLLVFMSVLMIFLIFDRQKLYYLLNLILRDISEYHHNDVILHRDTQELISKVFKKRDDI